MGAPPMIGHVVQVVRLREDDSVDRQIMTNTAHLTEGDCVRIDVGNIPAHFLAGTAWDQHGVVYQFESENPDVLIGWTNRLKDLGAQ
tara:strand:+ start:250 stop:510 length:261 start_codon:yes stop_codon:yes gene_type:complete